MHSSENHKREHDRALGREWYRKNRERILKERKSKEYKKYQHEYHKKWVDKNRDKWNAYQREWRKRRTGRQHENG